jgi:hypothetical protein
MIGFIIDFRGFSIFGSQEDIKIRQMDLSEMILKIG